MTDRLPWRIATGTDSPAPAPRTLPATLPPMRIVGFEGLEPVEVEISNNHPKLEYAARFLARERGAPDIEDQDRLRATAFWHAFLERALKPDAPDEKPPHEPVGEPPEASLAWARKYLNITDD